ncbi:MAG TPA: aldose 1-epimerase family protein [Jatrophihabitans sp.]|nr:aldose 1-epimerase family protein [Jatrophihabitans sp.]
MPFPRPAILTDREWPLAHGAQRAVVAARGGALRSYQVGDRALVDGWADGELPPAFNGAVLAPWPNRLRGGRWHHEGRELRLPITEPDRGAALHGLVVWADWNLFDRRPDALTLGCRVPAQPGYPFELALRVRWSLTEAGLRCDLAVTNTGTGTCPFGIGAHPFFGFEQHAVDELTLTLPARTAVTTDARLLPTGRVPADPALAAGRGLAGLALDTAFTDLEREPDGGSRLRLASGSGTLTVWADGAFGWWQVYTSDAFDPGDPRYRRSVALEPMTCGPDALNTGEDLVWLAPGHSWSGSWGARLHG